MKNAFHPSALAITALFFGTCLGGTQALAQIDGADVPAATVGTEAQPVSGNPPPEAVAERPIAVPRDAVPAARAEADIARSGAFSPPASWTIASAGSGMAGAAIGYQTVVAGTRVPMQSRVQLLITATNLAPSLGDPRSFPDPVFVRENNDSPRELLQMRTSRSAFAGFRGALKFAVSDQSYLLVKPRRNRLGLEFRSSW